MNTLLQVEDLKKQFRNQPVVNGISFRLHEGECLGILGPNGAGKTTTTRLCLGLTSPTSGTIRLLNYQIPDQAFIARNKVGVVTQHDALDPDFTVAENIEIYGRYFGLSARTLATITPKVLAFALLENKMHHRIHELSGGMKRRLSVARALVNDPALVVLDEPTTGLDPQARHLMWDQLKQLVRQGKGILLTTHFMDEAERLCDRIIILDHGQIIAHGTPKSLIEEHTEPHVFEVHELLEKPLREKLQQTAARFQESGDSLFLYGHDPAPIMAIASMHRLRMMQRPSNLEDVFLKLTGHKLREDSVG